MRRTPRQPPQLNRKKILFKRTLRIVRKILSLKKKKIIEQDDYELLNWANTRKYKIMKKTLFMPKYLKKVFILKKIPFKNRTQRQFYQKRNFESYLRVVKLKKLDNHKKFLLVKKIKNKLKNILLQKMLKITLKKPFKEYPKGELKI